MTSEDFRSKFDRAMSLKADFPSEAISLLRELESAGEQQGIVKGWLGLILSAIQDKHEEAIPYLVEATKTSPLDLDFSLGLFFALYIEGRLDDAFDEMRRYTALRKTPEYNEILQEILEYTRSSEHAAGPAQESPDDSTKQ